MNEDIAKEVQQAIRQHGEDINNIIRGRPADDLRFIPHAMLYRVGEDGKPEQAFVALHEFMANEEGKEALVQVAPRIAEEYGASLVLMGLETWALSPDTPEEERRLTELGEKPVSENPYRITAMAVTAHLPNGDTLGEVFPFDHAERAFDVEDPLISSFDGNGVIRSRFAFFPSSDPNPGAVEA